MIKEVFLVCALALPVINIRIASPKEYKLLCDYAMDIGADMIILKKGIHKVPENVIKAPFMFRGMTVYLQKRSA
jgi:hypothetical protein